jgi:hypothetical protein
MFVDSRVEIQRKFNKILTFHRRILKVFLVLATVSFTLTFSSRISCFSINPNEKWNFVGVQKTCAMNTNLVLNSTIPIFSGPKDETITGLHFRKNRKVSILPQRVHETYPNLVVYGAESCSVKEIAREHFEKLTQLRRLNLESNQIFEVKQGVFDDLIAMEYIGLSE